LRSPSRGTGSSLLGRRFLDRFVHVPTRFLRRPGPQPWSPDGLRLLIADGDALYVLDANAGRVRVKFALRASAAGEMRRGPGTRPSPLLGDGLVL
jgi:hypothetical protein